MSSLWRPYLLTLLSLAGSAAGFLAQVILAKTFGISTSVDAYFFALGAPTFVGGLLSAAINFQLTPHLRRSHQTAQRSCAASSGHVTRLGWVLNGMVVAVGLATIPLQLWWLPAQSPIRTEQGLPWLLAGSWLFAGTQVQLATVASQLTATDRLVQAATLPLCAPLASAAVLLAVGDAFGVVAFLLGQVVGAGLAMLLVRRTSAPQCSEVLANAAPRLGDILRQLPFSALAIACFSTYPVIDSIIAPHAGPNTLTQISFAQRVVIGSGGLLIAAPLAMFANRYADLAQQESYAAFAQQLRRSIGATFGIASAMSCLFALQGTSIVSLLFQRGKFEARDVDIVGQTIAWMAPGMAAMLPTTLVYRAAFALRHGARALSLVGVLWIVCYCSCAIALIDRGAIGLAMSYSAAWLVTFAVSVMLVVGCARRHFNEFRS